jgi:hypothetical protein
MRSTSDNTPRGHAGTARHQPLIGATEWPVAPNIIDFSSPRGRLIQAASVGPCDYFRRIVYSHG